MDIIITRQEKVNFTTTITLQTGTTSAFVGYNEHNGSITVCCKNAAHAAYRGMGRTFWGGWKEVLNAYKSTDMKAIIQHVERMVAVA